jgi:hypothetical protein
MKIYKIKYIYKIKCPSPKNVLYGELFSESNSSSEAMSKTLDWLKTQDSWSDVWSIEIEIEETKNGAWL